MSWVRIWVHLVFSTKERVPYLESRELRIKMFQHIKQNADKKGIWMDCVNGYKEHVHCLISLNKKQSLSKSVQLLKGESSYWLNQQKILNHHFSWQDDYWAVGVSESHLKAVRKYIHSQETHHRTNLFSEEINDFMKKYGWEVIKDSQ